MIAGGGTGGHVFPGLAIAEALRRRVPDAEIRWVGTARGFEARMGAQLGYPLACLPVEPVVGRGPIGAARAGWAMWRACRGARRLLRRWRPDVVIGVGGYISVPTVLMAACGRYPTLLHEQNRRAGLANRFLGRVARRVCVSFPDSVRYFPKRKVRWTGNPIRPRVMEEFNAVAEQQGADFVLLVFGGSQGARALDQAVVTALPGLRDVAHRLRVIHQVGRGADPVAVQRAYTAAGIRAEVHTFIDAIGAMYRQADLVICRAGASSVTELTLVGRPAIIVPYPHAGNHQIDNARYLSDVGAAIVREERALTGEWLSATIRECLNNPERCRAMAAAACSLARPDAAEQIVDECMRMVMETNNQ